jgi:hypothetical protein
MRPIFVIAAVPIAVVGFAIGALLAQHFPVNAQVVGPLATPNGVVTVIPSPSTTPSPRPTGM